jgi:tRNA(fMet)-specific endonuclease VapC
MIILDTTFLIDLLSEKKGAIRFLEEIEDKDELITTTFVNIPELHKGAFRSRQTINELDKIDKFLEKFDFLDFTDEIFIIFGKLSAYLKCNGRPIGQFDELIASIALYNDAAVVTNNTKDFSRVPNLKIINH